MAIPLQPGQIPLFWEAIKFACTAADEVDEKDLKPYLVELLLDLESNRAQCWVRLSDSNVLQALLLTKLLSDKTTGESSLFIQCLYSWQYVTNERWESEYELILNFAKQNKCRYITFNSRNDAVWRLGDLLGFHEKHRTYQMEVS